MTKLRKATIIFKYLAQEPLKHKVDINGKSYSMDEQGRLCIKGYNETKDEEVFLVAFDRLDDFTALCSYAKESEIVRIMGHMVSRMEAR